MSSGNFIYTGGIFYRRGGGIQYGIPKSESIQREKNRDVENVIKASKTRAWRLWNQPLKKNWLISRMLRTAMTKLGEIDGLID